MKKMLLLFLPLLSLSADIYGIEAIAIDPILTGSIIAATAQAKKTLVAQQTAQTALTVQYKLIKDYQKEINDFQQQYNKYLDLFQDVLNYAAQLYGFYHEIGGISDRLEEFAEIIGDKPENAVAVALSTGKNTVYRQIIKDGVDIMEDLRQVVSAETKMTEKQRAELILGIRPKLKLLNLHLSRLNRYVKYTTMLDVWYEISNRARPAANNADIALRCMERWGKKFKTVR